MWRVDYMKSMSSLATPSAEMVEKALVILEPWRQMTAPRFHGFERLPRAGPMLMVGNHTLYGMLDVPLMFAEIFRRRGIVLRPLADRAHYQIPAWRDLLSTFGVVEGNRENCAALMRAGEAILVFPGGAREVTKNRDEVYTLVWAARTGFARMAIQNGCPIVPFAAVGMDDALDIVVDRDDIMKSPLGPVLKRLGVRMDMIAPVTRGVGLTPFPRPHRLYFWFGEPIDVAPFARMPDDEGAWALREATKASVEQGIAEMLAVREADPKREFGSRVKRAIKGSVKKVLKPR